MRRVYDEPASVSTVPDELWGERPDKVEAWGRGYKVVSVEESWETMREWWKDPLPEPMDHHVEHWRVAAVSERGRGVIELERRYEGWAIVAVMD